MIDPHAPPLKGLRRELTREMFEQLCALQCKREEILGYAGARDEELEAWCLEVYGRPLEEIMIMVRQDGIIDIRKAAFELQKKNATLTTHQINRFIGPPGPSAEDKARLLTRESDAAVSSFVQAVLPTREAMEDLFPPEEDGEEEDP